MNRNISVTDDIFSKEEYQHCSSYVLQSNKWRFSGRSLDSARSTFWNMDLMHEPFFREHLFNKIQSMIDRKFRLDRVYANGQVYGLDGSFHKDNEDPKAFTFLLYVIPDYIRDVNGCTDFLIDGQITSVPPVANRAVFFPSNIEHRGLAPGRFFSYLRVTIVWKMTLLEDANQIKFSAQQE